MDKLDLSPTTKIIKNHYLDKYINTLPNELQYYIYFYTLLMTENPIRNMMNNHINKCMYIRKFNLDVKINKCDIYLCNKDDYTYFDHDDKHTLDVLTSDKYNNIKIIHIERELDHDGYDIDGPESNLHDLYVYYKKGYNMYCDIYHREYWYQGEDDDPYELWY